MKNEWDPETFIQAGDTHEGYTACEDIYSEWQETNHIEDVSDFLETQDRSVFRYWKDSDSAKLNRLLVNEYDEKCDEIRTQMEDTADILYQDCRDIANDEQVYERFKHVRNHQDFELFDRRMWQKKAPETALGYHSPLDNSIGLRDGESILEEATHECIHSLSHRGTHITFDSDGNAHEILHSGIREIDVEANRDFARGLNEGLTQMYTHHVLDRQYNKGEVKRLVGAYESESKWATDLRNIAGSRATDRAYFNGDTAELTAFVNKHTELSDGWIKLCEMIDEYQNALSVGDAGRKIQSQREINNMFIRMRINSRKGVDSL